MDKKYISRFFDFFSDFDFNHDFDTNRHALSYTSCFCTSYLFLHILLVLHNLFCTFLYSITHFTLYFFFYLYIYICSCVVLLLYHFYSLHCPLSGPDLIYISRKPIRPFPKSCNMSLEQTNGKIHTYIYICILYVYVSNQIQQNKMQPEHVSEAERFNIPLCVCALLSVVHTWSSANDPLTLTGKPNPAQITRSH